VPGAGKFACPIRFGHVRRSADVAAPLRLASTGGGVGHREVRRPSLSCLWAAEIDRYDFPLGATDISAVRDAPRHGVSSATFQNMQKETGFRRRNGSILPMSVWKPIQRHFLCDAVAVVHGRPMVEWLFRVLSPEVTRLRRRHFAFPMVPSAMVAIAGRANAWMSWIVSRMNSLQLSNLDRLPKLTAAAIRR